jgi:LAS superfamily LD-carboxypeptidase LdcB
MQTKLTLEQLTGLDASHLVVLADGHRLQPGAAQALLRLQEDARRAGFDLAVASSHRSFARQLAIFNGKALGQRPVHDDHGTPVDMAGLSDRQKLGAILRFSALPGTSRHHWGTDLDVYDKAAVAAAYPVQLTPAEVAEGGPFHRLHHWLDQQMAAGNSHGFYRPYAQDHGGIAPERWHLSYAPVSASCDWRISAPDLIEIWGDRLALGAAVRDMLEEILQRYVRVSAGWCPRQ